MIINRFNVVERDLHILDKNLHSYSHHYCYYYYYKYLLKGIAIDTYVLILSLINVDDNYNSQTRKVSRLSCVYFILIFQIISKNNWKLMSFDRKNYIDQWIETFKFILKLFQSTFRVACNVQLYLNIIMLKSTANTYFYTH